MTQKSLPCPHCGTPGQVLEEKRHDDTWQTFLCPCGGLPIEPGLYWAEWAGFGPVGFRLTNTRNFIPIQGEAGPLQGIRGPIAGTVLKRLCPNIRLTKIEPPAAAPSRFPKDVFQMIEAARANDGEPVFLLRARDNASSLTLRSYIETCSAFPDYNTDHVSDILRIVREFEKWRLNHPERCKNPD